MAIDTNNKTLNTLAFGIASLFAGGGLFALVYWLSPIPVGELAIWALYVLLPLALIGVAVGLVSFGTMQSVWAAVTSKEMSSRINDWVARLRENPDATPEQISS